MTNVYILMTLDELSDGTLSDGPIFAILVVGWPSCGWHLWFQQSKKHSTSLQVEYCHRGFDNVDDLISRVKHKTTRGCLYVHVVEQDTWNSLQRSWSS